MKKEKNITQEDIKHWLEDYNEEQVIETENALNAFAKSWAVVPATDIKNKILTKLASLNQKRKAQGVIDISNPPLISEDSNLEDWLLATKDMQPPADFKDIHLEPIKSDSNVKMFVAWVTKMVPEEVHHDLLESFILLEGTCTCHITDPMGNTRIVNMQAGDYITMKTGETHDVCITSEKPAKAVLQWLKIAA